MKTVVLHGKKAAGRVALVDDGDWELVSRHRWHVWEPEPKPGRRRNGPYAIANVTSNGGRQSGVRMHKLITGWPLTDHRDHDGLNNQRYNLRDATPSQNLQNAMPRLPGTTTSPYKGVCWDSSKERWLATIKAEDHQRYLGYFGSDLEGAYAYDMAARELFGEFACTNFDDGPAQAMRDQWRAEREAYAIAAEEAFRRAGAAAAKARWKQRQSETRICEGCGEEYQSTSISSRWCGYRCRKRASLPAEAERKRRKREAEREQRVIPKRICMECGEEFQPKTRHKKTYWCGPECKAKARRKGRPGDEGRLF